MKHSIKPYSKRFKWSTKSNSIRSYLKDLSEAHEVFYKLMKGYLMLAWFLKEKQKHKGHKSCEQNKNQGIPIFVEEERWDANRGIPNLRCLSILWNIYLGCLGHPQAWTLVSLYSSHIGNSSFFKDFIHKNINKNLWDLLV